MLFDFKNKKNKKEMLQEQEVCTGNVQNTLDYGKIPWP